MNSFTSSSDDPALSAKLPGTQQALLTLMLLANAWQPTAFGSVILLRFGAETAPAPMTLLVFALLMLLLLLLLVLLLLHMILLLLLLQRALLLMRMLLLCDSEGKAVSPMTGEAGSSAHLRQDRLLPP